MLTKKSRYPDPDYIVSLYKKHKLKPEQFHATIENGRCCVVGILAKEAGIESPSRNHNKIMPPDYYDKIVSAFDCQKKRLGQTSLGTATRGRIV